MTDKAFYMAVGHMLRQLRLERPLDFYEEKILNEAKARLNALNKPSMIIFD